VVVLFLSGDLLFDIVDTGNVKLKENVNGKKRDFRIVLLTEKTYGGAGQKRYWVTVQSTAMDIFITKTIKFVRRVRR